MQLSLAVTIAAAGSRSSSGGAALSECAGAKAWFPELWGRVRCQQDATGTRPSLG